MWRTIVNQTYVRNVAVDSSGNSNNGVPVQVTPQFPGFLFNQPGSRINIQPSLTLNDLGAIQTSIRFELNPQGVPHRFNLAEGFESFAFFVNPDFSVEGTILDENAQWNGATSSAGAVSIGATHTATFVCDGINAVQIFLDGVLLAENYTTLGSVRSVGNLGIAVGHWPNPPDQYTFQGSIYAFVLQKYDPQSDLLLLLDGCCVDWEKLLCFMRELRKRGVTPARLAAAGAALQLAATTSQLKLRGGTKSGTLRQEALAAAAHGALRRRDLDALERVLKEWQASGAGLSAYTRAGMAHQFDEAFESFGLRASDWSTLMRLLCLDVSHIGRRRCNHGN